MQCRGGGTRLTLYVRGSARGITCMTKLITYVGKPYLASPARPISLGELDPQLDALMVS